MMIKGQPTWKSAFLCDLPQNSSLDSRDQQQSNFSKGLEIDFKHHDWKPVYIYNIATRKVNEGLEISKTMIEN